MPVHGSVANSIARQQRELSQFLRGEASDAGDMVQKAVGRLTPVGRVVDAQTGQDKGESGELKRSWKPTGVRTTARGFEAGTYTTVSYAGFVNDGTRPHIIRGSKVLRFWNAGTIAFYAKVKHPGTEPVFMVERGLDEVDREWAVVGEHRLSVWLERTSR